MSDMLTVKTEQFEGPLDLLYSLIEKRKLQINTISLATITDEYLQKLKGMTEYPTEDVTHFVYVASLLVFIKSKSLLPLFDYADSDENEIRNLESRMTLYTFIRTSVMPKLQTWGVYAFQGVPIKPKKQITFSPVYAPTQEDLLASVHDALSDLSFIKEPPRKRVSKTISIDEMIETIMLECDHRSLLSLKK